MFLLAFSEEQGRKVPTVDNLKFNCCCSLAVDCLKFIMIIIIVSSSLIAAPPTTGAGTGAGKGKAKAKAHST